MPTSQTSILSEVERGKPISLRTRAFYRRRLQNRIHRLVAEAFRKQAKATGLTQKQLAERIGSRPEQVNRWLGLAGNLTLNTLSDLLLGMAVDLDDPSVTTIADLLPEAEEQKEKPEQVAAGIRMA
jgi:transcriptional regulator with XRE-family HTH domain